MAILSPLKSRRLKNNQGETTQQIIVFQIEPEWFALPIFAVKKVVPRSDTQGNYRGSGVGLTVYEGRELLVLDVEKQVFGHNRDRTSLSSPLSAVGGASAPATPPVPEGQSSPEQESQPEESSANGYLLILRDRRDEMVGLPIGSPPSVRRVSQSALVPLPPNYAARINIQCVSGLIVQSDNQPILFFLNPDHLLHTQPLLPPSS